MILFYFGIWLNGVKHKSFDGVIINCCLPTMVVNGLMPSRKQYKKILYQYSSRLNITCNLAIYRQTIGHSTYGQFWDRSHSPKPTCSSVYATLHTCKEDRSSRWCLTITNGDPLQISIGVSWIRNMSRLFTWLLSLPRILTMAYIYMYFTHALIHVELPLPLDSLYLIWLKSSKLWNATNRWTDIHTVGQKNRSWKNRWSVESLLDSYSDYVTVQFCPFVCMFVHTSGWLSACVCACMYVSTCLHTITIHSNPFGKFNFSSFSNFPHYSALWVWDTRWLVTTRDFTMLILRTVYLFFNPGGGKR